MFMYLFNNVDLLRVTDRHTGTQTRIRRKGNNNSLIYEEKLTFLLFSERYSCAML